MVEFAIVALPFLMAVFFVIGGLLYAVARGVVVSAAQEGARFAASYNGHGDPLDAVAGKLGPLLRSGLPGTAVSFHTRRDGCPDASTLRPGNVAVCSSYETAGGAGESGTQVIRVRIYGRLPSLLPFVPAFSVDDQSVVHSLVFHA